MILFGATSGQMSRVYCGAETRPMSLALALKVRDGVVLCEDTRVVRHPEGMNYAENGFSKLRMFGDGCATAIAGDVTLMSRFLQKAEKEGKAFSHTRLISETIAELEQFFWKRYREEFPNCSDPRDHSITTVLFVGHGTFADQRQSFIYRMELNENFIFREEPTFSPAGQHKHGGLYYVNRFRRDDMTVKEAAFLCYLSVREVSSLDASVGPGVEIILCQDDGAHWAPGEWLEEFGLRHENAHLQMTNWFSIKN
jgi:20S proteasome alpha/beta subunit